MKKARIKIRMSKEREAAITTVVTEMSMDDVFAMAAEAKEKAEAKGKGKGKGRSLEGMENAGVGIVVSNKPNKSITVLVERKYQHPILKKVIKSKKNIVFMMRIINIKMVIKFLLLKADHIQKQKI